MAGQQGKGLQKSGYLDIKQSSKVKNRKLKTWKRRWIVVHQMSDLSSGTLSAKMDVYTDQESSIKARADKQTFFLEHVTGVQYATSKTHSHAFEIVETEPTLVLCASNNQETLEWMTYLKSIFFPNKYEGEFGQFDVSILPNMHSTRLNLEGKYVLAVTVSDVTLQTASDKSVVIKWGLNSLKKFYLDSEPNSNQKRVMVIESGPNSNTGEGVFRFLSGRAETILEAIRLCIKEAIAAKQRERRSNDEERARSVSFTASERNFRAILDENRHSGTIREERTRSILSSTSTISSSSPGSPLPQLPVDEVVRNAHSQGPLVEETKGRLTKNASFPNMATNDSGYSHIKGEDHLDKHRTMSLISRDSGIVFPEMDSKASDRVRKVSVEKRVTSNSFDSGASTGSNDEPKRKFSDVEQIREETPHPIYNDIEDKGVHSGVKLDSDDRPRRHSTGERKKENEYEDLEKFRGVKDGGHVEHASEEPPALPERPMKLRLRNLSDKGVQQRRGSTDIVQRHSCMGKLDVQPRMRKSSSAEGINEPGSALSRSSSKDLYASIPDLISKNNDNNARERKVSAVNQICLDIFSPSVTDWAITTGTPPNASFLTSPPDSVKSPILDSPPIPIPTGPKVDDLLGLSDFEPSTAQGDVSETVTAPSDLLLDFDPFDDNSVTNDLLVQDNWSTEPGSETQENPYIDMSANRRAELAAEKDLIYMAPNKM